MSLFSWEETPELNITPLVDIMLVLLAILMVTAPTIVYEETIALPKGSKTKQYEQQDAKIEIRVDAQRVIHLKNSSFSFNEFPDNFLLFSKEYDKNTAVYIRADKNLKYEDVIFILKVVKESGFIKASLVTDG